MSETIPNIVITQAKDLIDLYGCCLEFCGHYQGQKVYNFHFPDDTETGFPFVYLYDDTSEAVKEITGFEALRVISEIIENNNQ